MISDNDLLTFRKISTDYGFSEALATTESLHTPMPSRKAILSRSKSCPVASIATSPESLPRITFNDFSTLNITSEVQNEEYQSEYCVTLEDVRSARNSRLLKLQQNSREFDTWSCTNSSIGTSLDEIQSDVETIEEAVQKSPMKVKVGH